MFLKLYLVRYQFLSEKESPSHPCELRKLCFCFLFLVLFLVLVLFCFVFKLPYLKIWLVITIYSKHRRKKNSREKNGDTILMKPYKDIVVLTCMSRTLLMVIYEFLITTACPNKNLTIFARKI